MKKKIVSLSLAAALALTVTFGGTGSTHIAGAATIFAGGHGTQNDPYQITSVNELKQIDKNLKAHYILKKNIDLKGESFESIGGLTMSQMSKNDMSKSFSGSFNGNGHTISNGTVKSQKGEITVGFFECNTGTITDVIFKNIKTRGGEKLTCTSGIVGVNMGGTISNVTLKGKNVIKGSNCVGGIAGGNWGGTINKCKVTGTKVKVTGSNDFSVGQIIQCDVAECGGLIVGGGFTGIVNNCKATGTIVASGKEAVGLGGIGGCLQLMNSISGNEANVTIQTKNAHAVGGLCGYAGNGDDGTGKIQPPCVIKNCKVKIDIDTDGATHVGGLVGTGLYYYGMEDCYTVKNCSVSGTIDGAITPGTVAGRATNCKIASCKTNVKVDKKKSNTKVGNTYQLYQSADQYKKGSKQAAMCLLNNISGTYRELFSELNLHKYDSAWIKSSTGCVGKDKAAEAVNMLKTSVGGTLYGQNAVDTYTADGSKTAFYCGFLQGVKQFTFHNSRISGIDNQGQTIFDHAYEYIGYDKKNGFYEYQTKDANAGEFTYFVLAGDMPGTTSHIEFRYGSNLEELKQYDTGSYAYWMASGILTGSSTQNAKNAINIFCKENLK